MHINSHSCAHINKGIRVLLLVRSNIRRKSMVHGTKCCRVLSIRRSFCTSRLQKVHSFMAMRLSSWCDLFHGAFFLTCNQAIIFIDPGKFNISCHIISYHISTYHIISRSCLHRPLYTRFLQVVYD